MAIRKTTYVLKNSDIVNRTLPSIILKGEPIINVADGIMYFSGSTTSTNNWTQSSPSTPTFFEVGSNLYDLKLRNRITSYTGLSNLTGKFLSGTTNGFVLADIASIVTVDTLVTGFTYTPTTNSLAIKQNNGQADLIVGINSFSGLTVNGNLTATNIFGNGSNITGLPFVTGGTPNNATRNYLFTNSTGGTFTVNSLTDINITGGTYNNGTAIFSNNTGGTFSVTGFNVSDTFVTGFTYANNIATIKQNIGQPDLSILINTMTGLTVNGNLVATNIAGNGANITGLPNVTGGTPNNTTRNYLFTNSTGGTFTVNSLTDITVTGGTYNSGTAIFNNNTGGTFSVTGFNVTDTFVTGFTYTPTTNSLTIKQNIGQPDLIVGINSFSGLSISNLTANRLVYTTTGGQLLTGNALFDGTAMSLPASGSLSVGTGGLVVGSGGSPSVAGIGDLVVNGSLTVFGGSISAFTSQLYVEDNNLTLNYNPTGSTIVTSIGAGLTVQDGNGIAAGDVNFNVNRLDTFTGLTATFIPSVTEYVGATGYANRGWITQLNDIVIRSTNINTPNGVRVLTEFDILDGGLF